MTTASKAEIAASLADLRDRVDAVLDGFLAAAADELQDVEPATAPLVAEIRRLLAAGGKRLRPACCYWGFRATGGRDGTPIVRASAALELLHTMALVHDDLMDEAATRRGVSSVHVHLEDGLASIADPVARRRAAVSGAIIAGDLAAVLADRLFLEAGFDPSATVDALGRYHRMRTVMAAGQFLDVAGVAVRDEGAARKAAALKGGEYSVSGPLEIGAALAGATEAQRAALARFGRPLGEAFQLRDDLLDAEGAHGATPALVNALVDEARDALDPAVLDPEAVAALRALADRMVMA
ncbi:MAG: polyprenyl synthetase family protein [Actinomycetota bacterium]